MNEDDFSFDESSLSAEDLAVLRAFDAIESWEEGPALESTPPSFESEDTHAIFLKEVEEDLTSLLQALRQLDREGYTQPAHFTSLQRVGHKMRGTAGAMNYLQMAEVASHIEIIAEQTVHHMLRPANAAQAISYAVTVLESCLYRIVQDKQEPVDPMLIAHLQSLYTDLSIDLHQPIREGLPPTGLKEQDQEAASSVTPSLTAEAPATYSAAIPAAIPAASSQEARTSSTRAAYVDQSTHVFDHLIHHSERLLTQHSSIESAYRQVEMAFEDLQVAQDHFQRLELLFSASLTQERLSQLPEDFTSSSLVTRIVNSIAPREGSRSRRSKGRMLGAPESRSVWDELDIEHYTEKDMLLRSLREAMANVDACSSRLKAAYRRVNELQQEYMKQVSLIRDDTLRMRMAPLSTIVPQLREIVMASMLARESRVSFEVRGEDVEIDQEVLSSLSSLLIHMLKLCIDSAVMPKSRASSSVQRGRVWLEAHNSNNEITLEVGFSMSVRGGALSMLHEQIHLLNGFVSLARNELGGISFFLSFPGIRGLFQCLLVRVADQQLLIPLSHVKRVSSVSEQTTAPFYALDSLLDIPAPPVSHASPAAHQQVVSMQPQEVYAQHEPFNILVDEIVNKTEVMVKPFPLYIQRPGIIGSTIDGEGRVLLLLDVAELVSKHVKKIGGQVNQSRAMPARPLKILVAEDSASFRNSILRTLRRTIYKVQEARDGLEALELLKSDTPDLLLLDLEMPYLNGYDLLDIVHQNPQFANIKIIILTSRTSEKHFERAMGLGAHAYLTKPSPSEDLLSTIQKFLPGAKQ